MLSIIGPPNNTISGNFTLQNGFLTAQDTNEDGFTGGALLSTNSSLTLDNIEAYEFKNASVGGAVDVRNSAAYPTQVTVKNSSFYNNSASERGGALSIQSLSQTSQVNIINNKIQNNHVNAARYAYGGGIYINAIGEVLFENNLIDANTSSVNTTLYNHYWSHGGGLSINSAGNRHSNTNLTVTLKNNQISNNQTQLYGGGIYFYMFKNTGDIINLESGVFMGNHSGNSGGAIDYSVHGQPTLQLNNVLISNNESPQGGGIWACPTARTITYSTLGGAILDNKTIENERYDESGHDIRFEGFDTRFSGYLRENDPTYHRMTIRSRTFLGDLVHWYNDDFDNRYEEGDPILSSENYTDRASSFGLYGEIASASDWYTTHFPEAKLIFINNTADSRGGAIATNSDIIIGEQEDIQLEVVKQWQDEMGNLLTENIPEFVEVRLIQEDSSGRRRAVETIQLSAANAWKHTFDNLPSKGLVNGEIMSFTYSVEEISTPLGFTTRYETSEIPGRIQIVNQLSPIEIPVQKIWDDGENQDGVRPSSIIVRLVANDEITDQTLVLEEENDWKDSFIGLYAYRDGMLIDYTVEEVALADGYISSILGSSDDGYTITNSRTPSQREIPVRKVWVDNKNQVDSRPTLIQVNLLANGKRTGKEIILSEENNWTGAFIELDFYKDGEVINYTVQEINLMPGYLSSVTGNMDDGFVITNTFDSTETSETTETTESPETSEPTESSSATETSEPTESSSTTEPSVTTESSESTGSTETQETSETIETTGSSQPTEPTTISEPIETHTTTVQTSVPETGAKDYIGIWLGALLCVMTGYFIVIRRKTKAQ